MDTASTTAEIAEPELAPVVCPHCGTEVDREPWPQECPRCFKPIDLQAQFAYCRGHNAFTVGQDILITIYNKKRRSRLQSQNEKEGLLYYMQAYSALQQAFQGELAESQRLLGIQMMAAIAKIFQINSMISPFEAGYWSYVLVEYNSNKEVASLKDKLAQRNNLGLKGILLRMRWKIRIAQLQKALGELDQKLRFLEQNIGFTERMRLRQKTR